MARKKTSGVHTVKTTNTAAQKIEAAKAVVEKAVEEKAAEITGYVVDANGLKPFTVTLGELTDEERQIILKGCLINYNRVEK